MPNLKIKGRVFFPNVFKAVDYQGDGNYKFKMSLGIRKDDTEQIEKIKKAFAEAQQLGFEKTKKKFGKLSDVLRDGDEGANSERPEFNGMYYLSLANTDKVPVVKRIKGTKDTEPITAESGEFYAGCMAWVDLDIYPSKFGNIAVSLGPIMKAGEGTRLSGGNKSASAAFADDSFFTEDEDDAEFS